MSGNQIRFRDRLRDRGFIDQWGFIGFAVAGFVGIVSAKWFRADTVWVSLGAVIAMMLYALVIARKGSGRLRADQAGDNCYYLGLIYTLASLSYAIATFDPNDPASTIVQGFGIALATTIFGLILRVFFSQGRPDLENVEEQSRLELTAAVSQLKGELSVVVREISDFGRQVQQSMAEVQASSKRSIETFTKTTVEGLHEVVESAAETIRDEANDFAARSKKYSTTFEKLIGKLELHGDVVGRASEMQEAIAQSAAATRAIADNAKASVDALLLSSQSTRGIADSAQNSISSVASVVANLAASTDVLNSAVSSMKEETDRRIKEMNTGPADAIAEAMAVLSNAARGLATQLADLEKIHDLARSNVASQSESALNVARMHNDLLEKELGRSRDLVERVHSSLADMTGKLANRVEGIG